MIQASWVERGGRQARWSIPARAERRSIAGGSPFIRRLVETSGDQGLASPFGSLPGLVEKIDRHPGDSCRGEVLSRFLPTRDMS